MFKIDDTVLYGQYGVCKITEITKKVFDKKTFDYYVLKPIYDEKSTFFVPTENEVLVGKIRPVLSPKEALKIIAAMEKADSIWIENQGERKETYKNILAKANPSTLSQLVKTLYIHQQEQQKDGKKLHVSDAQFMKDAEKILYDEFALVLNIKPKEVAPYIMKELGMDEA